MSKNSKNFVVTLVISLSVLSLSNSARAGGYEVAAHSGEGMGLSNAGISSGYSDGSALYFNPAAIASIPSSILTVNGALISLGVNANDNGSKSLLGSDLTGEKHEGEVTKAYVPSIYYVNPVSDKLSAGLFLVSPFGLGSEFDKDWIGRYQAIKSDLTTIQTGVGAAYKLTDSFSLGAAISSIYADAELSNAVDFGSIGVAALGPTTASALGLSPQQNDGLVTLDGSDWAMGWNVGAAFTHGCDNRNKIGLSYRGSADINIHGGYANFDVPTEAAILTSTGAFADTSTSTSITLPEAVSLGMTQWVSDDVALLAETKWTRWSRFDQFSVNFANPAQPTQTEVENWQDTWRHSVGVSYVLSPDWTMNTGFAFDESPIGDSSNRTARVPESDQYWGSLGVKYKVTQDLSIHFAYQHVWLNDGRSNRVGGAGDTLNTTWKNGYDDFGLGFVYSL